jgi:hypothetical protein
LRVVLCECNAGLTNDHPVKSAFLFSVHYIVGMYVFANENAVGNGELRVKAAPTSRTKRRTPQPLVIQFLEA